MYNFNEILEYKGIKKFIPLFGVVFYFTIALH